MKITIQTDKRIHFSTNHGGKIFGAFSVNLSQFLTFKNNNVYFLTKENNVIWCDFRMFARIYERYSQRSVELPKALEDARMHTVLNF